MRYYEYISFMLRKEDEMSESRYPMWREETKPDTSLLGYTTCGYDGCSRGMFPKKYAVTGCIQVGETTHQEHFCSNICRDKWRDQLYRGVPYYGD
jgi:hypothetical protein